MAVEAEQPKARVFISYSRKDLAFADRLDAALKARGFEPLIDRTEIYAFEDWWNRLQVLIAQADTVVFVLSPDAVASHEALKEVEYAASLNKRFAPIVCRRVEETAVPEALRRLNFIFFDDPSSFEPSVDKLAEALRTDIGWIRQHTEFGGAARRWSTAGRPGGLLLRSLALEEAERWIASRPPGAPDPTAETQALVAESRRQATRRRNVLTGSLAAGLLVALALAGLAYWQRGVAVENEALAVANGKAANDQRIENLKSESRSVSVAAQQLVDENRPGLAQAIALEGLPDRPGERPVVADALNALKRGIRADQSLAVLTLGKEDFLCAAFSPDGKTLVTGTNSGKLIVWDLLTYRPRLQIQTGNTALYQIDISPDGRKVLAASDRRPEVWDLTTGKVLLQLPIVNNGFARRGQFSPDGKFIAIGYNDNHAEVRDAATGELLHRLEGSTDFDAAYAGRIKDPNAKADDDPIDRALAERFFKSFGGMTEVLFSPDGKILAVAGEGDPQGATRLYDVATGELLTALPGENLVMSLSLQRVSFSPNSALLAVAAKDNVVRVWSVTDKKLLFALPYTAESHALTFDASGAFLIVGYGDGSVRVWSTEDGQNVATFAAHLERVSAIAFNPRGDEFATASEDRNIGLWWNTLDADSCGPADRAMLCDTHLHAAAVLRGHTGKIRLVTFSPDGNTVASIGEDSTLRIWRAAMAGMESLHVPAKAPVAEVSCEPPTPAAPVTSDKTTPSPPPTDDEVRKKAVELFGEEAATEEVGVLREKIRTWMEAYIRKIALKHGFAKDEAATEDVGVLREKVLVQIEAVRIQQAQLVYDACRFGKIMSQFSKRASRGAKIDSRVANQMQRSVNLPDGADDVYRIAFAGDGEHLLAPDGDDRDLVLWNLASGQFLCGLPGKNLSWSAADGALMIHQTPFSNLPAQCPAPDAPQPDASASTFPTDSWAMSPDGARAVGSSEWLEPRKGDVGTPLVAKKILIDTVNKKVVAILEAGGRGADTALFSADGTTVIGALAGDQARNIGDATQYAVWNAATGALLGLTAPGNTKLDHIGLSSDGRQFVLARDGGSAAVYYVIDDSGHLTSRVLQAPSRDLSALAIASDGTTVAAAYVDGTIAFFSTSNGKLVATLSAGIHPVTQLAFSPDARLLAGADTSRTVWLWDVASKTPTVLSGFRRPRADRGIHSRSARPQSRIAARIRRDGHRDQRDGSRHHQARQRPHDQHRYAAVRRRARRRDGRPQSRGRGPGGRQPGTHRCVEPKTMQTNVSHVYAAGDVIGFPSLASTSMEQGRVAACHAFGMAPHPPPEFFPYGIYSVPEISTVGMSEEEVRRREIPYECGIARFRETSRGHIMGLNSGMIKMIFSTKTRRLLGVHIVGEGATELIHIGQAVLNLKGTIDYFIENTFNYPTLAEAYKIAGLDAWNRLASA